MRLLFTAHTGPSHLRALVGPARLAVARGHDVLVASSPSMRAAVASYGLAFAPVGRDWDDYADLRGDLGMLVLRGDLEAFTAAMYDRFHFGTPALDSARDLSRVVADFAPHVIVREGEDIAGYLAAEAHDVPHVAVVSGNTHDLPAAGQVDRLNVLRGELGLPPEPVGGGLYRHLTASFLPPRYYGDALAGPTWRCYRPADPADDATLPAWFGELDPARPLVLASLGTVAPGSHAMADGSLADIVAALSRIECEAIVSVGVGRDIDAFAPAAPHVRLVNTWLPQSAVLSCADLFVTHAGLGSVRETLRAGVPVVAVPQWDDQPYQARRCAALGAGVAVTRRRRRAGESDTIEAACREVLAEPAYRREARRLQREMLALPSGDVLLDDVEELAAGVTVR